MAGFAGELRGLTQLMRAARALAAAATLAVSAAWIAPASAADEVITAYAQSASADSFTADFTLSGTPKTRLMRLVNPDRIAVDFVNALPAVKIGDPAANAIVDGLRHGLVSTDRYRVIYRLKESAVARIETRETDGHHVVSLIITKSAPSVSDKGAALASGSTGSTTDARVPVTATAPPAIPLTAKRPLRIVIDPGHGGIDNGAVSKSGTREKDINLAIGKDLRDALKAMGNIDVVMTRDDDTFIPLEERSAIGRREKADLFISLHADSIRYSSLRGATVYTLSENASDALSQQIATSENAADRFAGEEWQNDKPDVFDILIDLTRRETVSFSEHFASSLVDDLSKSDIRLITRPKRAAGFRVLKAPDVPSVLVEMGFLSNPEDEKLLKDDGWRGRIAQTIARAVLDFFRGKAAEKAAAAR